jgi:hypothetical protein
MARRPIRAKGWLQEHCGPPVIMAKRQILGKITIFTQQFVINIGSKILYKITCADKLIKKDREENLLYRTLYI